MSDDRHSMSDTWADSQAHGSDTENVEKQFVDASKVWRPGLRDSWDSRASDWEKKYRNNRERSEHETRILDIAAWLRQRGLLGADCDVIDVGCGPGRFAAEFAKTARSVKGVDISPKMTGYGEQWCRECGLVNTTFHALDFNTADVAELGWEGKFDLAFSSITPAIATVQGLENLIRVSRGWCFNASFIYLDDPLHEDIMRTVFGREPRTNKTSHSYWFYELFSLLWSRGFFPETSYYKQVKSSRLNADRDTAQRLARMLLEEGEATDDAVSSVQKYLVEHADPSGCLVEDSECLYGWLIWNVQNRMKKR
ncbi:MAG: methyltransferase domain-containing protein [Oscillospiraceae bacterium]|nr:methyltransferase domain-containing protein [Oscillospiraceae bacterium]